MWSNGSNQVKQFVNRLNSGVANKKDRQIILNEMSHVAGCVRSHTDDGWSLYGLEDFNKRYSFVRV